MNKEWNDYKIMLNGKMVDQDVIQLKKDYKPKDKSKYPYGLGKEWEINNK